ncbi:MAG: universal stress protein [Proteobacteria bacterium]|nr:universal stress protein [Pseudomonadota bacterium]MDE3207654.1 universal stress protein [Pseudomonadota bacterium]
MDKKVLCATDGSHASMKAVAYSVDLAHRLKIPLTFLVVHPVEEGSVMDPVRSWDGNIMDAVDWQVHKDLVDAQSVAKKAGLTQITLAAVGSHNIPEAIVKYASAHEIEHIVVGSTGRSEVAKLLLGSVASRVVSLAHCPVTVVR